MWAFENYPNLTQILDEFRSGKLYEPLILRKARAELATEIVNDIINDVQLDEVAKEFCDARFKQLLTEKMYSHGFPISHIQEILSNLWQDFSPLDRINFVFRNCDWWLPNCANLYNIIVNYIHKHIALIPESKKRLFQYKTKQIYEHVNSYSVDYEFRLIWDGVFNKCKKSDSHLLFSVEYIYNYLQSTRIDDLVDTDLIKEHYNPFV